MKPLICLNRISNAFSQGALVGGLVVLFAGLTTASVPGAEESELVTKAKEVVEDTTAAASKAGHAAADSVEQWWHRVDAARLKNRTPDEIVAWVVMGVLVGAVAGMMTKLKPTGLGKLGRLLLGLAGAFLGGIVVRVTELDFGWGPVLIRYEELAFALSGAILLLVLARFIRSRSNKQVPKT